MKRHFQEQSLSVLSPEERVHVQEYYNATLANEPHVLLDVRSKVQFEICSLPNSIHIPLAELEKRIPEIDDKLKEIGAKQGKYRCTFWTYMQIANLERTLPCSVCRVSIRERLAASGTNIAEARHRECA